MEEKGEKRYNCQLCGRPINHQGNCFPCNINKKYGSFVVPNEDFSKKEEIESMDGFIKSILEEDYYGDRLLLRRKQRKDKSFREYVFNRYNNSCFFCKRKELSLDIYHTDYVRRCKIPRRNKGRKRGLMTCRKCKGQNPKVFEECINSVMLLCRDCHEKVHRTMEQTFGSWLPSEKLGKRKV